MAREFPRFLFSNPQNTKSPGPFLVHCLYPKCIMRVINANGYFGLEFLEFWEEPLENDETGLKESQQRKMLSEANIWLKAQIIQKQISLLNGTN